MKNIKNYIYFITIIFYLEQKAGVFLFRKVFKSILVNSLCSVILSIITSNSLEQRSEQTVCRFKLIKSANVVAAKIMKNSLPFNRTQF